MFDDDILWMLKHRMNTNKNRVTIRRWDPVAFELHNFLKKKHLSYFFNPNIVKVCKKVYHFLDEGKLFCA